MRAGMVEHPSEYPWSSYHYNALGEENEFLTPHTLYRRLGRNKIERQKAYRQLFRHRIPEKTLEEIREATNKAWVLGKGHFREKVEKLMDRQSSPKPRGGDRKSEAYRKTPLYR